MGRREETSLETPLTFHLQVRRAAELDIAEAKVWYETQRPGLGIQFQAEISHVFSILEETPLSGHEQVVQ